MISRKMTSLLMLGAIVWMVLPLTASAHVHNASAVSAAVLTISVSPNLTVAARDGYFNVSILLTNSSQSPLFWAYVVDITYPPNLVEIPRNETEPDPSSPFAYYIYQGALLKRAPTQTSWEPTVDNNAGLLHVNETIILGAGGSAPGPFFNVTFKVKDAGIGFLHINSSRIIPRFGADIDHDKQDGVFAGMANPFTQELDIDIHVFFLRIDSNSTLTPIELDQPGKALFFNATGTDGTDGYTMMVIPKDLLDAVSVPWFALFDTDSIPIVAYANQTHTLVYVNYTHSMHQLRVIGDHVVPEFSTVIMPMALLTATAFAVLAGKKLARKREHT